MAARRRNLVRPRSHGLRMDVVVQHNAPVYSCVAASPKR
jgi:hypothetical protein